MTGLQILKYPRTPHLVGSRRQPGDDDVAIVGLDLLSHGHVVVEEKIDGSNAAVRFDAAGRLHLQSRGHFLVGGSRERQFDLFKTWAPFVSARLFEVLGHRHIMYGEWCFARHTLFYDELPHYFLEFDVYDVVENRFLSTAARRELLGDLPVVSVPVLHEGTVATLDELHGLIGPSLYKSAQWHERLMESCRSAGLDADRVLAETDLTNLAEGLYIKVEDGGGVVHRCKLVRQSFRSAVAAAEDDWLAKPLLPNKLADGVNIFEVDAGTT